MRRGFRVTWFQPIPSESASVPRGERRTATGGADSSFQSDPVMRSLVFSLTVPLVLLATACPAADSNRWTMLVDVGGREIEGMPLAWSSKQVFLLARDGRLWDFVPNQTNHFRKTSSAFSSFSPAEIRAGLERELGAQLEVTGTRHYLVAHPRGQSVWANRFEELYRSCVHYFSLRDLKIHEPEFPLVAIVWPKREDFFRYAQHSGSPVRPEVLGYYSPTTNRVALYDQGNGAHTQRVWQHNDATIIHEATHQMAFNTGVHNRFSPTPMWLAEGLGTMFEAPGVWNWRDYPRQGDRINRNRLAQFRQWQSHGRAPGEFATLIGSDRLFQTNPSAAYAEAWAWVFFLTETYPQKFSQYVQRVADKGNFTDYPLVRRNADFSSIFGSDLRMLEKHFLAFIAALE